MSQYPDAVEACFQTGPMTKIVINSKPVERDGQTYDYKMMLADYVRQQATADDLVMLVDLLKQARKCMGLKGESPQHDSYTIFKREIQKKQHQQTGWTNIIIRSELLKN